MVFGKQPYVFLLAVLGEALAICLSASPSSAASPSPCTPPRYEIVKTRWDQNERDGISMSVAIDLRDFAPERLLCLADSLAARYKRDKFVDIDFFSSRDAALTCLPDIPLVDAVVQCPQRHAEYRFNAKQHSILMLPMGNPEGDAYTSVDLPARTLRPCRLEIAHRCFLELTAPDHEYETLAALISATVVVSGTIDRSGRAEAFEIRVATAKNVRNEKAPADPVVRTVIESVRSWRLEESERETPFNVRFEFDITDDLSESSLEFRLPHRVIVRATPSLLDYKVHDRTGSNTVKGDGLQSR